MIFTRRKQEQAVDLEHGSEFDEVLADLRATDDKACNYFAAINLCFGVIMRTLERFPRGGEGRKALHEAGDEVLSLMHNTTQRQAIHKVLKAKEASQLSEHDMHDAKKEAQDIANLADMRPLIRETVDRKNELMSPETLMPPAFAVSPPELTENILMTIPEAADYLLGYAQENGWPQLSLLIALPDFMGRELESLAGSSGVDFVAVACAESQWCVGLNCSEERGASLLNAVQRLMQLNTSGKVH